VDEKTATGHLEPKKRWSSAEIHNVHVSVDGPSERDFDVPPLGNRSRGEHHTNIQIASQTVSSAGGRSENDQQLDAGERRRHTAECVGYRHYSMSSV
jgi:hypothetical protein